MSFAKPDMVNANSSPQILTRPLHLLIISVCVIYMNGCALMKTVPVEGPQPPAGHPETVIQKNDFTVARGEDVIGQIAEVRLERDDSLPDIARHFSLGINAISAANPGVDVWVPGAGERLILPLSFVLPDTPRKGIVINLAAMRLFQFKGSGNPTAVSTYPVGVGTAEKPTPMGSTFVKSKTIRPTWNVPASIAEAHRKKGDPLPEKVPPGPLNPLGEYAMYLNKTSYLIHGTNKPASIGLNATNGCIRLYPEDIRKLYRSTPVRTPVSIVSQTYLVGQRDGVVYLEAHRPLEGAGDAELENLYAKLRRMEKKALRPLNWKQVEQIVAEARGVPVPILQLRQNAKGPDTPVEVRHPGKLHGKPQLPELRLDAWYVLAADLRDDIDARRLAAMINHQGPPIPARVLARSGGYRVIAGPFSSYGEAGEALRRLKIDLEIDGILIEPAENGSRTGKAGNNRATVNKWSTQQKGGESGL